MDANAKVGSGVIKGDPNHQSENGKLMIGVLQRQNLYLLNGSDRCEGVITRYRKTINSEEKAVLDYAIGCSGIFHQLQEMLIDEERIYTLTKYASTKGARKNKAIVKSDHNPMFCKFDIRYENEAGKKRKNV